MKRSLITLAFVAAAACFSAVSEALNSLGSAVRRLVDRGAAFARNVARKVLSGPISLADNAPTRPQVLILAAKHFVARIVKRERPTISSDWRMCPST